MPQPAHAVSDLLLVEGGVPGFDDSGFAKTILLCEPEEPFLGTVRLEALHYRNVDISKFYPYGDPRPFQQRSRPC